jgi:hypothetical protein
MSQALSCPQKIHILVSCVVYFVDPIMSIFMNQVFLFRVLYSYKDVLYTIDYLSPHIYLA